MSALTPYLIYIKLGIIGLVVYFIYSFGVHHEGTKRDLQEAEYKLEQAELISQAQKDNEALKTDLKEQYDENTKKLAIIASSKPHGVRLPSICANDSEVKSSTDKTPPDYGLLSGQIESILDADRQRTWGIVKEAEQVINECRIAVDYLKHSF